MKPIPPKCPQCGDPKIFPRDAEPYCENCGWPHDWRRGPTMQARAAAEKIMGLFCPEGHDEDERDNVAYAIDNALEAERAKFIAVLQRCDIALRTVPVKSKNNRWMSVLQETQIVPALGAIATAIDAAQTAQEGKP